MKAAALLVGVVALAGCGSSAEQVEGHFVYPSDDATPNVTRLFVMDTAGNGKRKVTAGLAREGEQDPDWSLDGSRVAFSRTFDCAAPLDLCWAVWVVDADTGAEEQLTPTETTGSMSAYYPRWSPDGQQLAYVAYDERSESSDVWVMKADGSEKRRLTHLGDASQPAWSPDGRRLVLTHDDDLYILNLETRSFERLARTPAISETFPDWSPDGQQVAFEASTETRYATYYGVYVTKLDASKPRKLSGVGQVNAHPVWSPEGGFIAYGSEAQAPPFDPIIVIVEAHSGRHVRTLTLTGRRDYSFDWTAD